METWQTYPIEFRGGLITNLSPLQQGINAPGSATLLRNFEPSIEGGYRRIQGYDKYDSTLVPPYGNPVVHGASQSGASLIIANIHKTPEADDVFKIVHGTADVNGAVSESTSIVVDNVSGTIAAGMTISGTGVPSGTTVSAYSAGTVTASAEVTLSDNVALSFTSSHTVTTVTTFDATHNRATLAITPDIEAAYNLLNAAEVTFTSTNTDHLITGLAVFNDTVIVQRNFDMFKTTGSGYTHINVPTYGSVEVDGGLQTGYSLVVDGLNAAPQAGDVFKIAGVDLVYTITADATVTSGGATLAIHPELDTSPADNADITFLSVSRDGAGKLRFDRYNFDGTDKIILVDGASAPSIYDGGTYTVLNDAPADVVGATDVKNFKNSLFFVKGSVITFTSVYTDSDFSAANGAGTLNIGDAITGLSVFREQLFVFAENSIYRISGSTIADFRLDPITRDIGCLEGDTIQEVGSDIMFLGPDGLRLLSATERNNDISVANISKNIQSQFTDFISRSTSFSSVLIRNKSQYRILGYTSSYTEENAFGVIVTQLAEEGGGGFAFAETRGIQAYVADSELYEGIERIVFANKDGYIYQLEQGNSFDGGDISATFITPNLPIQDPRVRKTFYKMFLYTDPSGIISFDVNLKLDFDQTQVIQPGNIDINNLLVDSDSVAVYGSGTYYDPVTETGSRYGGKLQYVFEAQLIGSGYTGALSFTSTGTNPPFSLDAVTIEYANNARR